MTAEDVLAGMRARWESRDRPGGTIARDDVLLLTAAVEAVLAVIKEHRDLAVDYTPGFQDGMDQMAGDIEIAVTTTLGATS